MLTAAPCPSPPLLAPLHWGNVALTSRYLLAPLAGYTNLAFRLSVREQGGLGLATTDLVNARALLTASRRTMELIQTCPEDRPVAVQIYGSNADEMSDAARWLQDYGVTSVDINMGCPVHKVTRGGGGSAMLCGDRRSTAALVRKIVAAVSIPVTVKMRLGWDDDNITAPELARDFEDAGVAAVIVHGRTRAQGFGGGVNLDGIRRVVEGVRRIPVIGNGDVRTVADAAHMLAVTGCHGIAIGRGALLNPWFFSQLARWERSGDPGPGATYAQRLDLMARHFGLLVENRGERFACLSFRKVANWYCRVLRPGREVQQRLMQLNATTDFDSIVGQLRQTPQYASPHEWRPGDLSIAVPGGPIEHW